MSAAVSFTLAPPSNGGAAGGLKDIALTAAPPAQSVKFGTAGQFALTVKQVGGRDSVQLSCSGLPAGMSCIFSAATVTPDAAGSQVQLTVNTAPQSAQSERSAPVIAALFSGIGLLGLAGGSRRRKRAFSVVLLCTLLAQVGCGGGAMTTNSSTSSTTAVSTTTSSTTYTITVNAVSGTVSKSTMITLTVN